MSYEREGEEMKKYGFLIGAFLCWFVVLIAVLFFLGCGGGAGGGGGSDSNPADTSVILYQGEIYGDFITIFEKVQECAGTTSPPPYLILTSDVFWHYGDWAYGAFFAPRTIKMVAEPKGVAPEWNNIFAHELRYYLNMSYDTARQCSFITLPDFDWQRGKP